MLVKVGVFDKVGVWVKVCVFVVVGVFVGVEVWVLVKVSVLVNVGVFVNVDVIVGVLVGIIAHETSMLSTEDKHSFDVPAGTDGRAVSESFGTLNTIIVEEEAAVNSNDLVSQPKPS